MGGYKVCQLDANLQWIYGTHPSYMTLYYPLLFPYGTYSWGMGIPLARGLTSNSQGLTICQYYVFRIQFHLNQANILLLGGGLFLQFIADCFIVIEQWWPHYVRTHQVQLQIEVYIDLEDAIIVGEMDTSSIGRRCILPSSFSGGLRYMRRHFLDAIAICSQIDYPNFFITFICNPNQPEIEEALKSQTIMGTTCYKQTGYCSQCVPIEIARVDAEFQRVKHLWKCCCRFVITVLQYFHVF